MAGYTREQADKIKQEASEEARIYIEDLEKRLIVMYGLMHQILMQVSDEGLPQPEPISDVLYKEEVKV